MSLAKKIKNRMPGGYCYKMCMAYRDILNRINPENKCLKGYLKRVSWLFFVLGFGWIDTKIMKSIYNKLQKITSKDGMIKLFGQDNVLGAVPSPRTEQCFGWMVEFVDIIAPSLFYKDYNYEKINMLFIEGPYELNDNVCIKSGDVVLDCGAEQGFFSAAASLKGATVYAFEPSTLVRERYLSKTSQYNKNIIIQPYALSDKEGELKLTVGEEKDIGVTKLVFDSELKENMEFQYESVKVTTIDSFVEKHSLTRVDFIKCDIEGAERNMLRGAKNTLKTFAPKLSICTYHLPDDPEVLEKIIIDANPNYIVEHAYQKLYAYVP